MSIAEIQQPRSSANLTAVPDLVESFTIGVSIVNGAIVLDNPDQETLQIPWGSSGQITWSLGGGHSFDPLGIQFTAPAPFVVLPQDPNTNTIVAIFNNDNVFQTGPFAYTISVEGVRRSDPTVENDPST